MPDPLTTAQGVTGGLEFFFAGILVFAPIWTIAKFALM